MYKLLLFLFANIFLANKVIAQSGNFTLYVDINGMKSDYELNMGVMSSLKKVTNYIKVKRINQEEFQINGWIPYPMAVRLEIKNKMATRYFYIEPGKQTITTIYDSLYFPLTVKGSLVNTENIMKFIPFMTKAKSDDDLWWKSYTDLKKVFNNTLPSYVEDSMRKLKRNIDSERDSFIYKYCKNNPNSFVAFWKLYDYTRFYGYSDIYYNALNILSNTIKSTEDGKNLKNKLFAARSLAIGNTFPFEELISMSGKTVSINSLFGSSKYILIDFWYSHCTPCIAQFEELKLIYSQYKIEEFQIIGISTDLKKDKKEWISAISKYQIPWLNLWTPDGFISKKYFIESFPTNYLIDQSGRILFHDISLPELKIFLSKNIL